MTPRLWFGVGVRLLGLWQLLCGFDEVVTMFGIAVGNYHSIIYSGPSAILPFAAFHLIAGATLIKGAPILSVWFYPIRDKTQEMNS